MPIQRILLVDDSVMLRTLAARTLTEAGYSVVSLDPGSVFEVLKVCTEFQPDLVILDHYLPRCNSVTLAVILKEDPAYHYLKILGISSTYDPVMVEAMLENGADAFLKKGTMDSLVQAVQELLR